MTQTPLQPQTQNQTQIQTPTLIETQAQTPTLNHWLAFLGTQQAQLRDAGAASLNVAETAATPVDQSSHAEIIGFGQQAKGREGFVAPLTGIGLIAAAGDDAASFLHGQLTNDVTHLDLQHARLAGYCTPKGRLLATMLMWKTGETIMLQLPREIQPVIQKRLQMFIMRARARLADVSETEVVLGLAGPASSGALAHWFEAMPSAPYEKADSRAGTLIRLADAEGAPRYQWVTTPEIAIQAWPRLVDTLEPKAAAAWRRLDILAGIPQITRATQEQFVPQMINYEAIDGVNFKKGCYPGQEIVARSQYLGKLKRRMILATLPAGTEAVAGMDVFASADPEQPCGMVVNAEVAADGSVDCLVEIKTAVLESGSVHLGSASGAPLRPAALPYIIPEPD